MTPPPTIPNRNSPFRGGSLPLSSAAPARALRSVRPRSKGRAWLGAAGCALALSALAQPVASNLTAPPRVAQITISNNIPVLVATTNAATDPLMSLMLSQPRLEVSEPVVPVATFEPPVVRPGDPATYRVVLNALEDSIVWPETVRAPEELALRPAGRGQVLQLAGPVMQPRTTFNYRVKATELGRFTIPEFKITVGGRPVIVPEASLEVHPSPPVSVPRAQILGLEPETTNLFVGQSIPVRILLPGTSGGIVQGMSQVQVVGKGIITDQTVARQRIETVVQDGRPVATFIYETMITAIDAGEISVFAQGYAIGNRFTGAIVFSSGGASGASGFQYTLLDSDPVTLKVRLLPQEGRLPGFTGAIGLYQFDRPRLERTEVKLGEPVKFSVTLRGEGNLPRVVPPPPPDSGEWQVFSAPADNLPMQVLQAQGFTRFHYTLIPMTRARATPAIPFSYFDPYRQRYVDLTIPSVPLTVLPGRVPTDPAAIARAAQLREMERAQVPSLSGIALAPGFASSSLVPFQQRSWFVLVQAAPVALLLGLWAWDRRRRFLEQHPEVVRRRKARRALRRQRRRLARAATRADEEQYTRSAVEALRIACAPHYPAEPRALVCGDVLEILTPLERQAGEPVVRRVFEAADANRFAGTPLRQCGILATRADLDSVLDRLAAKLSPGGSDPALSPNGSGSLGEPSRAGGNGARAALLLLALALTATANASASGASAGTNTFEAAVEAYRSGDFAGAAGLFRRSAAAEPSSGALLNLGNAEWQRKRKGHAILAWEQALWIDPSNSKARRNLQFARRTEHREAPSLAWFEVISTWLPANAWAWVAGASLWLTVGLTVLPGIFRLQKSAWHQAVAAASLVIFLLSLPAHIGVNTRSRIGFIIQHDTPLRLTPTREAQFLTRLADGEPARIIRARGDFVLVRAARTQGWVYRQQFGRIAADL